MTTKTKDEQRVPLFTGTVMLSPYGGLDRDDLWREIAVGIEGYAAMQQRVARLKAWPGLSTERDDDMRERAKDEAVRTGDFDAAVAPLLEHLRNTAHSSAIWSLHSAVLIQLAYEADSWVASSETQEQFAAIATERARAIMDRAYVLDEKVAGARSFNEIGADAGRAAAFAEMGVVAGELERLMVTVQQVVAPMGTDGFGHEHRWPEAWLLGNYEHVWPTFWRREELVDDGRRRSSNDGIDGGRFKRVVLDRVAPPWRDRDPQSILRLFLDQRAVLDVASRSDAANRASKLDAAASKRRGQELERHTTTDWHTDGPRTEFTV